MAGGHAPGGGNPVGVALGAWWVALGAFNAAQNQGNLDAAINATQNAINVVNANMAGLGPLGPLLLAALQAVLAELQDYDAAFALLALGNPPDGGGGGQGGGAAAAATG